MQEHENSAVIILKILYLQRIFILFFHFICYFSRKQTSIQSNLSILLLLLTVFFYNIENYMQRSINFIVYFILNELCFENQNEIRRTKDSELTFARNSRNFLSSFLSDQDDISMRNLAIISDESRFEQINSMCQVITWRWHLTAYYLTSYGAKQNLQG